MATTFPFSNVTATVGTHELGPMAVSDSFHAITSVVDRTVTGGMNSLTSATKFSLRWMQSNDGGTTWFVLGGYDVAGGTILGKNGQPITSQSDIGVLADGTSRQVKLSITISGPSSVVLSGSFSTS